MPKHADFTVLAPNSLLCAAHGFLHGEVLVVAGKDTRFLRVTAHGEREVGDYVNQTVSLEYTLKESLKVGQGGTLI